MNGFDWPGLMQAGLRGLGLKPAEFWALTPAELRLMLGEAQGGAPLVRDRLDALMQAYPDMRGESDE
ncbi:rcc01693 family protein [Roseovarius arcticus]|uniref:rcc01693 family protein n=1 Tax=Roseovarius arcticus TaxID=2547404 RepID=UPI001110BA74|nr:rcc01693 family protein [Roseovarius arcticus]